MALSYALDLEKAAHELLNKPIEQIEAETALAWAARAVVAFRTYQETKILRWALDGESYCAEAIEHAALSGDDVLEASLKARLRSVKTEAMVVPA